MHAHTTTHNSQLGGVESRDHRFDKVLQRQILNSLFELENYQDDADILRDCNTGCYTAKERRQHRRKQAKTQALIAKLTAF